MEILSEMKANDPDFNYTVQVDEESRIKTLMWVTSRGFDQYRCFGDAITFDTTYRTNLYDMPFGLFVGVNNHFQSIIFGGAMMRDEKEDTFKWIVREFIRMVGGKHPQTILTNQARAMELAIEVELPNTVHRWCKWHVLKKANESMGVLWSKNSNFKMEFHKLVHHMITEEEFGAGWQDMLEKYNLRKHPFLTQIYEVQHKWAKPYFRGVFCAKMNSTQRSESANHLLKGYVPSGCPMHLFLKQFEKLQFDRESEESFQEKSTLLSGVSLRLNLPIERHASKVYTRAMFEKFDEELYKCGTHVLDEIVPRKIYKSTHIDAAAREKWSKVEFKIEVNDDESFFSCECGTFEHSGLVCCHALQVMVFFRLSKIPEKHIMKRWTRDARDVLPAYLVRYQRDRGPPSSDTFRHHTMYMKALECVLLGDSNVKCYDVFMAMMKEVQAALVPLSSDKDGMGLAEREQQNQLLVQNEQETLELQGCATRSHCDGESSCSVIVGQQKKRPRGRPTTSRDKALYEEHLKRLQFCTICRSQGHKCTTCPERGDVPKAPRKLPKCLNCGVLGHRSNACGTKKSGPFEPNFL
ncbi:protein FAR1-RELATED SEQUENCE 5-like isoform X2 [Triticum urartu]|nr:protein FAR1-RELATED SEQUENCE 5-like isoform X2 [Triticum urartu]